MVPRNLFRHLIPRMSRRGFLWGKLRQSRVLLSKQRLNLPLLLWLKLDTLWSSLQRFPLHWRSHLGVCTYPFLTGPFQTFCCPPWFQILYQGPSCPALRWSSDELITQLKDLLCKGFCREVFQQDKTCPQQTMLYFLQIAGIQGFSLGSVLCFLLSLQHPLQKEIIKFPGSLLFLCTFLTFSWTSFRWFWIREGHGEGADAKCFTN